MLDHQSPSDRPWTRPRGRYATSINSRFSKPWALNRVGLDLARKNRSCLACNDQLFDDVVIIRGHTASSSTVSDKCENIKICSTMPYATTAHYSQLSQTLKKKKKPYYASSPSASPLGGRPFRTQVSWSGLTERLTFAPVFSPPLCTPSTDSG